MRSTGMEYSSADHAPVVLPEMAQLLPPLTGEQLTALEADLLANGCYTGKLREGEVFTTWLKLAREG